MQELEICTMGLFIIAIMFYLCIDVFKKSKSIKHSNQNQNELSMEVIKPVEIIEVVYPMYIDCSRNTQAAEITDLLVTL